MAKTKKELFDDVLTALVQVGQIKACAIVSKEGFSSVLEPTRMLMPEYFLHSAPP